MALSSNGTQYWRHLGLLGRFQKGTWWFFWRSSKIYKKSLTKKNHVKHRWKSTPSYIKGVLEHCKEVNLAISDDENISHPKEGVAEDIYQTQLTKEISITANFNKLWNYIEYTKQKRLRRRIFDRLFNVAPVATMGDEKGFVFLIRRIVQEELHQLAGQNKEFSKD